MKLLKESDNQKCTKTQLRLFRIAYKNFPRINPIQNQLQADIDYVMNGVKKTEKGVPPGLSVHLYHWASVPYDATCTL